MTSPLRNTGWRAAAAVLLAAAALAPLAASASGLSFLARGPMSHFNDADMKLFTGALGQALTAQEAGGEVRWANERTGASGEITPQRLYERNGAPCRDLKVVARHRATESTGVYPMCRRDGRWRLAQ
ncbi:MAG: RT0821/Lpp0805 family surface protein [Burkholderiaceae bacterium]|jgi:surface antigen|nr:RT0821/Lpp0805 family surface protein [Burkholderiaceae bacterium]